MSTPNNVKKRMIVWDDDEFEVVKPFEVRQLDTRNQRVERRGPVMRAINMVHRQEDEIAMGSHFHDTRELELGNARVGYLPISSRYNEDENPIIIPILNFEDMGLCDPLCKNLTSRYGQGATAVQALAIPLILHTDESVCIRAPTGSGKSASFLAPAINKIHLAKSEGNLGSETNSVYAIVICNSRDMAIQLAKDAIKLSSGTEVKVACVIGGMLVQDIMGTIKCGCDIVVGTVGRLDDFIFDQDILNVKNLMYILVDEVDSLEQIENFPDFYQALRNKSEHSLAIFASATANFNSELAQTAPVHLVVQHDMPPPSLVHNIINTSAVVESLGRSVSKLDYLLQLFTMRSKEVNGFKRVPPTIVFAKKKRTIDTIAIYLISQGFRALAFHGDKNMAQRAKVVDCMKKGDIDIIVSSEVLSRGVNLNIDYVINYDLPMKTKNFVEFVHRVGRAARLGNYGVAITFFDSVDDVFFAPYLKRMLEHYEQPVPDFIENSASEYIASKVQRHEQMIRDYAFWANPENRRGHVPRSNIAKKYDVKFK